MDLTEQVVFAVEEPAVVVAVADTEVAGIEHSLDWGVGTVAVVAADVVVVVVDTVAVAVAVVADTAVAVVVVYYFEDAEGTLHLYLTLAVGLVCSLYWQKEPVKNTNVIFTKQFYNKVNRM